MVVATLPQKRGGGNLRHNKLFASKMVCDKGEGTAVGVEIQPVHGAALRNVPPSPSSSFHLQIWTRDSAFKSKSDRGCLRQYLFCRPLCKDLTDHTLNGQVLDMQRKPLACKTILSGSAIETCRVLILQTQLLRRPRAPHLHAKQNQCLQGKKVWRGNSLPPKYAHWSLDCVI